MMAAKRSAIGEFVHDHPWMTFFIVTGAVGAVVTIVRGRREDSGPKTLTPPQTAMTGQQFLQSQGMGSGPAPSGAIWDGQAVWASGEYKGYVASEVECVSRDDVVAFAKQYPAPVYDTRLWQDNSCLQPPSPPPGANVQQLNAATYSSLTANPGPWTGFTFSGYASMRGGGYAGTLVCASLYDLFAFYQQFPPPTYYITFWASTTDVAGRPCP